MFSRSKLFKILSRHLNCLKILEKFLFVRSINRVIGERKQQGSRLYFSCKNLGWKKTNRLLGPTAREDLCPRAQQTGANFLKLRDCLVSKSHFSNSEPPQVLYTSSWIFTLTLVLNLCLPIFLLP